MANGPIAHNEGAIARPETLTAVLAASCALWPDKRTVEIEGSAYSMAQIAVQGERRARQMLGLGVRPGDRVGVLLPNGLDYIELLVGAALIGAIVVPMNIRYKALELRHLIADSSMVAVFTRSAIPGIVDFAHLLAEALPGLGDAANPSSLSVQVAPSLRSVVALGPGVGHFVQDGGIAAFTGALPAPPRPEDALLLMYTSGTTANPKGCIVPNRAIISNAWSIVDRFGIGPEDAWWCPLPMFHIGGLLFLMVMLAAGGLYGGMIHFDADRAIDMLAATPPTIFYPLFPTITLALIAHRRFKEVDLDRLRYSFNLAPDDVQRRIQAALPQAPLLGAYGLTEACGTVAYGQPADNEVQRLTTCGTALPGWEIRILDQHSRRDLTPGEQGEIAVRGAGLFAGYFNDPALTTRQFLPDGFFLTGDVGSLDAGGRLSFHGRFKDQLKVGGENVSALEVESCLASHPAVNLAQIVGIADERYGEVPAAFIELKAGHVLTENDVIAFCNSRIARFKVPRHVRFVESWPMSATKIIKSRLREALEAEFCTS